jgi:hypothetical protein
MKFLGIIAIVSALTVASALPVLSKSENNALDVQQKDVKSGSTTDAMMTDMGSTVQDTVDPAMADPAMAIDPTVDSTVESNFVPFYITSPMNTDIYAPNDM